jgi:DNA polymerase
MDSWETLKKQCSQCQGCDLGLTRKNLVFGVGNEKAAVMFIGEGPGQQEDLQGEPFVGPAGQLLDTMLEIIGLDRTQVYIANIVKCRPPGNRDPLPDEQTACMGWLQRQIDLVDPKILVFLGRIAARAFIGQDFRITREHGQWFQVQGRPAMALYHPSALLRDLSKRPETFVDLKQLQQEIQKLS